MAKCEDVHVPRLNFYRFRDSFFKILKNLIFGEVSL